MILLECRESPAVKNRCQIDEEYCKEVHYNLYMRRQLSQRPCPYVICYTPQGFCASSLHAFCDRPLPWSIPIMLFRVYRTNSTKGRFTLRWRSPLVMNSRGILKFDQLVKSNTRLRWWFTLRRSRFLCWRTLCMDEKMTWMPMWRTLSKRGVPQKGSSP